MVLMVALGGGVSFGGRNRTAPKPPPAREAPAAALPGVRESNASSGFWVTAKVRGAGSWPSSQKRLGVSGRGCCGLSCGTCP